MQVKVDPTEALKQFLHGEIERYDAELEPKILRLRAKERDYLEQGRLDRASDMRSEVAILMSEREMALHPIKQHLLQIAMREDALRPPAPYRDTQGA